MVIVTPSSLPIRLFFSVLLAMTAGLSLPAAAAEPLRPDQLLLVYNRDDARSRELAEYYAKARSVPIDRLCGVRANANAEEISREHFDRFIRPAVRAYLESQPFGRNIRCLVLFYGLPIRVGPKKPTAAEQSVARQLEEELKKGLTELAAVVSRLEELAGEAVPQSAPAAADEPSLAALLSRYERARVAAGQRIDALRRDGKGQEEFGQTVAIIQAVEGVARVVAIAAANTPQASENAVQVEKAVEQIQANEARIRELFDKGLTDPSRAQARQLIRYNHGLAGYLRSLLHDIASSRADETTASLDSELSLVWWDDYILYRWVPNLLSWNVRANPGVLAGLTPRQRQAPVLMACRIDGPTLSVARRIIDDSIAVEKTGLQGKVYLDARGLSGDDGLVPYDQNLRDLAALLARLTDLPLKLDVEPGVFRPRSCPNAALYCGWYSLRQYVDAFDFVPGAVGYHMASFEAISIKAPAERGWVKALLNDGVAATLGSVAEPYLQAFPKPRDFFGLLLTGQFTLAECFAYTTDFNSWMMLLIGDPLYRPFAVNPPLKLEQVFPSERIPPEFRPAPAATQPATSTK